MLQLTKRGKLPQNTTGAQRREYIEAQIKKMGLEATKNYFSFQYLIENKLTGAFNAESWVSSFKAVYRKYKPTKQIKKVKRTNKSNLRNYIQNWANREIPEELLNALVKEAGSIKNFKQSIAAEEAYEHRNMD